MTVSMRARQRRIGVRVTTLTLLAIVCVGPVVLAGDHQPDTPPSLPFFRAHRVFIAGQLAAQREQADPDAAVAAWLDQAMIDATTGLGAARRTVDDDLITDVAEPPALIALAGSLDSLGTEATEIEARLAAIRDDFANHAETELFIVLGATSEQANRLLGVELFWNGYRVHTIELDSDEREALVSGGYQPLHRAHARPLPNELELRATFADGSATTGSVQIAPTANRLTVVVLDVSDSGIESRAWTL